MSLSITFFTLRKYQEGIRERYGKLRLDSLDTKGLAYNIELLKMFIPQKVRETQEFIPQIQIITDLKRVMACVITLIIFSLHIFLETFLELFRRQYIFLVLT